MTIDDIFDELFDDPKEIAGSISLGLTSIDSYRNEQLTPEILKELAKEVSGFNKIPLALITDDLMEKGIGFISKNARFDDLNGSAIDKYRLVAIQALEARSIFLGTLHPELIDKPILLAAISNKAVGPDGSLLSNLNLSDFIDDEIGKACIGARLDFVFKHLGSVNISDDVWIEAIKDEPGVSKYLVGQSRDGLVKSIIADGFWPETFLGKKPKDLSTAVGVLAKNAKQDGYESMMIKALILNHPIEEVLPLFKTPARKKVLSTLYSIEELKPHMKDFPAVKSVVLEGALGL
jgi:hypothetical protein